MISLNWQSDIKSELNKAVIIKTEMLVLEQAASGTSEPRDSL